jgi:beta-phosphoglucomutase family hydrolase
MGADTDRPRLPNGITACLFDLDGVLTKTATVHAAAWKEMFDEYLCARAERTGEKFVPFDPVADYDAYVDGLPRADGTRTFLHSRGIDLPEGGPADPPDAETVHALSERKNQLVLHKIEHDGVEVYPGSVRFLRAVRAAGMPVAVVSSSANCAQVLASTGLDQYVDTRIDGIVAEQEHLAGKPAPDTYLAGAKALGVPPSAAAELRHHGADTVVTDLAELLVTE